MHVVNGASAHDLQLPRRRGASQWATGNLGRKASVSIQHRPQAKRVTPLS